MTAVTPGSLRRDARPPITMDAAPAPGVTADRLRPTVVPRPLVTPLLLADDAGDGHLPADPAVRRFWSAVIGPGAVADLLRLVAAAARGRRMREPLHLSLLASEGLCLRSGRVVAVRPRVPRLGPRQLKSLSASLRSEYGRLVDRR